MFFFFKQKTAYEMRISDWSSDVCSSDLRRPRHPRPDVAALAHKICARLSTHCVPGRAQILGCQPDGGEVWPSSTKRAMSRARKVAIWSRRVGDDAIGRASCRDRVCNYV